MRVLANQTDMLRASLQQRESKRRRLNLHAANAPNFWMFLKEGN
jgi:hypothetical protein